MKQASFQAKLGVLSKRKEIVESPLNHSRSKQMYSFGKDARFKVLKLYNYSLCYNQKGCLSTRAAKIGYGQRKGIIDISIVKSQSPSPGQYETQQLDKPVKYSFGRNRDQVQFGSMYNIENTKYPSPQSYDVKDQKPKGKKYTFGLKIAPIDNRLSPGPAKYSISPTISQSGRNILSKFPNPSKVPTRKEERFPRIKMSTPGPGYYQTTISSVRESRKRINTNTNTDKSQRISFVAKSTIPGVGSYQIPTEFGYYGYASK